MNAFASALALLRVCSVQQLSLQLDALSDGYPLQWIARLQHQRQYEGQHCSYAECNERITRAIGDCLIRRLPGVLRPLGYVGISALLDEHVREALGLPRLHPSLRSKVRWVIKTYQHRTPRAEGQSIPLECQATACEYATLLFQGCRSDPVEFLLYALCFARAAPPIVMNKPQVP